MQSWLLLRGDKSDLRIFKCPPKAKTFEKKKIIFVKYSRNPITMNK